MPVAFNALLLSLAMGSADAQFASPNFVVHAPTVEIARQVADAAEEARRELAMQWYGHEINNWGEPCEISVQVGKNLGAGGATRFKFDRGEVYGWKMEVQGSLERILDSVIPHEVNHTILACYFRRKVPRWADEGAATVVEHISEKGRSFDLAEKLVSQGRRIPLRVLLNMTQYPGDSNQVLAMYAQGYSLTEFLIQAKGRQHFLNFLNDAHYRGWDRAIATFYGSQGVEKLEQKWSSWVLAGSPRLDLPDGQLLAATGSATSVAASDRDGSVVRSQGPDAATDQPSMSPEAELNSQPVAKNSAAALLSRVGQFTRNLTAPDPRSREVSTEPAVFAAAESSVSSVATKPVPEPRATIAVVSRSERQAGAETPAANQPLQPLVLTKIDDRRSRHTDPAAAALPAALPGVIQSRFADAAESGAPPARFRETRLRTTEAPKKTGNRFLNWSQFPSQVR
ncbi:MAG: hypothetical protein HQ518_27535 [Rhodopirellula sp.]|nr:hypothetical protein [Rhodopirellula sp.]